MYSGVFHWKGWFSVAMLNYQRVKHHWIPLNLHFPMVSLWFWSTSSVTWPIPQRTGTAPEALPRVPEPEATGSGGHQAILQTIRDGTAGWHGPGWVPSLKRILYGKHGGSWETYGKYMGNIVMYVIYSDSINELWNIRKTNIYDGRNGGNIFMEYPPGT